MQFVQYALIEQCRAISAWHQVHNPAVHYVVVACLSSLDL